MTPRCELFRPDVPTVSRLPASAGLFSPRAARRAARSDHGGLLPILAYHRHAPRSLVRHIRCRPCARIYRDRQRAPARFFVCARHSGADLSRLFPDRHRIGAGQGFRDLPACFEGTGWELFKRGWGLWLLSLPIVTLPFTYLALQAVIWQWWLSGIRFGEVRFESNLRTGALMGLCGAVVGWMILIAFVNLVAMAIGQFVVVIVVHLIGGPGSATLVPPHAVFSNWATIGLLVANFVVLALCASIVVRIYLVRELWGAGRHINDHSQSRSRRQCAGAGRAGERLGRRFGRCTRRRRVLTPRAEMARQLTPKPRQHAAPRFTSTA
jgi:hypothetical protein